MATRKKKSGSLEQKIDALTAIVEKGFAAVAGDIAELRTELKSDVAGLRTELKGDIAAVHDQVNSVERQLRETKTEVRLSNLEEKVFGASRA